MVCNFYKEIYGSKDNVYFPGKTPIRAKSIQVLGGFQKRWAYGVNHKAHPNLGENAISWA
jgi:hypothetical protein